MYFWGRINEKFDKIVKAFRYFDVQSVSNNYLIFFREVF